MKRILGLALGVVVATAGLAAAQSTAPRADQTDLQRGQALLERNCASCHAIGRTGASPHPQAPPFRVLGKRYPIESLEESLGEGLLSGHPDMPEFRFDPTDVGAVIAYLKSIQDK